MGRWYLLRGGLTGKLERSIRDQKQDELVEEMRVAGVIMNQNWKTEPDETNRGRTVREIDVTRCCDLGGCSTVIYSVVVKFE
jgi:hypothetical protein